MRIWLSRAHSAGFFSASAVQLTCGPLSASGTTRFSPSPPFGAVAGSRPPFSLSLTSLARSPISATAPATSTDSGVVDSVSPAMSALLLLFAPLLQPRIRFVGLDQAFQACLHLGRHAGAAVGLFARIAVLGLAHQHLAHLGVHEVIEQPAGVRQDLARTTDLLFTVAGHRNTSHPARNPPGKPATNPTTSRAMMRPVTLSAIARPSPTIRRPAS